MSFTMFIDHTYSSSSVNFLIISFAHFSFGWFAFLSIHFQEIIINYRFIHEIIQQIFIERGTMLDAEDTAGNKTSQFLALMEHTS